MGFSIALAEDLLQMIESDDIKNYVDVLGYKSEIEILARTVSEIAVILREAELKVKLSDAQRVHIEALTDALYDADDLFDELMVLSSFEHKERNSKSKLSIKVRTFFSRHSRVAQAYRLFRDVKKLRERLLSIVSDKPEIGLTNFEKGQGSDRHDVIGRNLRRNFVLDSEVIGRDFKDAILEKLLDPDQVHDFCVSSIVGKGGVGKTTLARLVYNDDKIENQFDQRFWVSVSENFDLKSILCKILNLVTRHQLDATTSTLELVQSQYQEHFRGLKFFLVLDDLLDEDRENWLSLSKFLMLGQPGSKVLVITRSERTANITGSDLVYVLEGLSQDNAWCLFERTALTNNSDQENHHEYVEIGKKIVKSCHNLPLLIKVVGSLLQGQDLSMWHSFEKSASDTHDNTIYHLLKLCYKNLEPSLKSCFGYCAVFPRDSIIEKQMLISLWMAQGYIVPLDRGQSVEDAAEEHFSILLHMCFFEIVERDIYGDVKLIGIHDLMHDLACEMGGVDLGVTSTTNYMRGIDCEWFIDILISCDDSLFVICGLDTL